MHRDWWSAYDGLTERDRTVTHSPSCGIFISTGNTTDDRVVQTIDLLKAAGYTVTTSPLNPAVGTDSRWNDWYESGCRTVIESNDVFLAIVTAGYDCSTWMAIEFEKAWKANKATSGRPRLFVLHRSTRPFPPGLRQYEESATLLPFDVNEAVAFLRERVPANAADEPRVLCTVGGSNCPPNLLAGSPASTPGWCSTSTPTGRRTMQRPFARGSGYLW